MEEAERAACLAIVVDYRDGTRAVILLDATTDHDLDCRHRRALAAELRRVARNIERDRHE